MVTFYIYMIDKGSMTVDQVPWLWHDDVVKKLEEREHDKND
ncbi:hypothetical protein [Muricomes intestini]|jgi:hypothetical protein